MSWFVTVALGEGVDMAYVSSLERNFSIHSTFGEWEVECRCWRPSPQLQ